MWLSLGSTGHWCEEEAETNYWRHEGKEDTSVCAKLAMTNAKMREDQNQAWFVSSDFRKAIAKVNSAQRMEFVEAEPEHKEN